MKFATSFNSLRFVLSPIKKEDSIVLFEAVTSESFPVQLPLAKLNTLDLANTWCTEKVEEWASNACYVWSCRQNVTSNLLGQITLVPQKDYLMLAYWVHPSHWGKGIATEMCRALIQHLSQSGYQGKIWAGVHNWNTKSESVLAKLGFELTNKSNEEENGESTREYSLLLAAC